METDPKATTFWRPESQPRALLCPKTQGYTGPSPGAFWVKAACCHFMCRVASRSSGFFQAALGLRFDSFPVLKLCSEPLRGRCVHACGGAQLVPGQSRGSSLKIQAYLSCLSWLPNAILGCPLGGVESLTHPPLPHTPPSASLGQD